ncbi:MAG: IS1595 family transposase [Acidimicrobiaceae bacterium]|nr:IS1595 family transposase [Acidimicrobiaceae bacterium]MYH78186.1 IS1595 family transposase [Acidimicrobiaceae bacterium]MYK65326.1 IS1595 family transposase [Gemmatimonadota bacterium]
MAHNAPGKHHRRGMTLADLFRRFPDDASAEAWIIEQRWPGGVQCPHCESDRVQDGARHPSQRFRCRDCGKRFSPRTGTVMADSNIGYQNWAIAVYAVLTNLKGVSSMKLHRDLGITQSSAWFLLHRIREAWNSTEAEPFAGPVEADETFVGGRAKNMHAKRRREAITGRGPVNKTAVVGIKDRATNRVAAAPVADTSARSLVPFVASRTAEGADVFTDEHGSYKPLASLGYCHAAVAHGAREYVRGPVHTNGIESLWSMFKRGYIGTYHHMSEAHTHRYVNEFTGRHNIRPLDTEKQMASVCRNMVGKRLKYDDLVAA